jgi:adenylylsulfate kinase
MIVLMAGLPGSGKSTLARALAAHVNGRVLSKDEFRHAIFSADEIEYSTRQDDFVLDLMLKTAGYLLSRDRRRIIFLDGRPFSRRYQIENVIAAATFLHQPWRILECVCSEHTARLQLQADLASDTHPAANRDYDLYLAVKSRYETIMHPKTIIDTEQPLEASLARALASLG